MRCILLLPVLLVFLALPATRGRYNDDFDDGEDLADFDDNDFAEFEDMNDDQAAEPEIVPPARASAPADEDEDEDEATVELDDGGDGFDDSETQVCKPTVCAGIFKEAKSPCIYPIPLFFSFSVGSRCVQQI